MRVEDYIQEGRLLGVLIDPEKAADDVSLLRRIEVADLLLVGGSTATGEMTERTVRRIKGLTNKPVVLFPGSPKQFTKEADALLFLSVMTSKDAEMLAGRHIAAARKIKESGVETIPMGYILIDGGRESSVQKVSGAEALRQTETEKIVDTAIACCLLGKRLIYLEAGSGAAVPVRKEIICAVRKEVDVPLIVGGGICTREQMEQAYEAGADIVVIGNYLEHHPEQAYIFGNHKQTNQICHKNKL